MSDRYEKICQALAMGPTPGPWEVANGTDVFTQLGARNAAGVEAAANDGWHIADCDMGPSSTEEGEADIPYVEKRANAALIAACDPDTIRALLDERDALRAENDRLRAERDALAAALKAAREDAEPVVRFNDDGTLDEVVGRGQFHLEQMGDGHWWMQLGPHMVNLTARGKIRAHFGRNEAAIDQARGKEVQS